GCVTLFLFVSSIHKLAVVAPLGAQLPVLMLSTQVVLRQRSPVDRVVVWLCRICKAVFSLCLVPSSFLLVPSFLLARSVSRRLCPGGTMDIPRCVPDVDRA